MPFARSSWDDTHTTDWLRILKDHCSDYASGLQNGGAGDLGLVLTETGGVWSLDPDSIVATAAVDPEQQMYMEVDNLPPAYKAALVPGATIKFRIHTFTLYGSVASVLPAALVVGEGGDLTTDAVGGGGFSHTTSSNIRGYAFKRGNSATIDQNSSSGLDYFVVTVPATSQAVPVANISSYKHDGSAIAWTNRLGDSDDPGDALRIFLGAGTDDTSQNGLAVTFAVDIAIQCPPDTGVP